jgi:hypothetical protein
MEDLDTQCAQLLALASGLVPGTGICIQLVDDDWAWNVERNTLFVSRKSVRELGVERCAGYIAHECGHVAVSRYPHISLPRWPPGFCSDMLNSIEDPRAEAFMAKRFPGVRAWFRDVHSDDADWNPDEHDLARALYIDLFSAVCGIEHRRDWIPVSLALPPVVFDTLETTREARRRYTEALPPVTMTVESDVPARFAAGPYPRLRAISGQLPLKEMSVYVSAWDALVIAESAILPQAKRLYDADALRLARGFEQDVELRSQVATFLGLAQQIDKSAAQSIFQDIISQLLILSATADGQRRPSGYSLRLAFRLLELRVLIAQRFLTPRRDQTRGRHRGAPRRAATTASGDGGDVAAKREGQEFTTRYDEIRNAYRDSIRRLSCEIESVLERRRRLDWQSG